MANQTVFLGKISNPNPLKDVLGERSLSEQNEFVTVNFDGSQAARLDPSYPRARAWTKMIDYLQKNNRPVWVEIDTETNIITTLRVPQATRVGGIQSAGDAVDYVYFLTAQARHYLRHNHPDYQSMRDALQTALDTDTVVLVTAADDFEIIDVRPLPASFGPSEAPGPKDAPTPPSPSPPDAEGPDDESVVTMARAVELFDLMKAPSCVPCSSDTPCIPFRYPRDGCWIRAHLMCYLMVDEGETPEKIWIDGRAVGGLTALSSNVPECHVNWGWHVAPTLMVAQASGPDLKMVIDPSLCDGPVTVDAWKALQGNPSASLTPTSWTVYHYLVSSTGTATQAQADVYMDEYRNELDILCATYGPSPYACPIVKNSFFIVDRSTISKDEIDAMLSNGSPAVIEAAFFVVVDGFTPDELGITAATLSGMPNIKPTLTATPAIPQLTMEVMPTVGLAYPSHLNRRQRITWKYKFSFTGTTGFVDELAAITLSASIATVSATATIYLIKQPNPYEIDGETAWLSTDLRVFQIKEGESRFNQTMETDAPYFITNVIQKLNDGNTAGQTFEGISVDQQTSRLELSESVNNKRVYNFAVAKVRYRALSVSAQDVRVFFRLFPASSTSLEYNQATTYRRATQAGVVKPLLGIIGGETVTIPCFAAARIDSATTSMIQQPDPANVQTIPPNAAGNEVVRYFGCWLDINQTQPQFPLNPATSDGPFPAADRKTIQELIRFEHQCLVAEIAFDPTPIPNAASPSVSDKLAQRNLAIVTSANPGDIASHRIPQVFEIKPTHAQIVSDELPDELMIDWGNTPAGSTATLFLPGANANDILNLATKTYRSHTLVRIDAHSLQCEAGGVTYIPIPHGEGPNYAGMLSVDLPATVKKGQAFTIVVNQVTTAKRGSIFSIGKIDIGLPAGNGRRILGSFQLTIPVKMKEDILDQEERLLSNLRWIQRSIPQNNRWFPVFNRYVQLIGNRVDALGGDASLVVASPSGDWKNRVRRCQRLGLTTIVLLALLLLTLGLLSGGLMTSVSTLLAVLLLGVGYYWIKNCQPTECRLLHSGLIGLGSGTVVLAVLLLLGVSTTQLPVVLGISLVATALIALRGWMRNCF